MELYTGTLFQQWCGLIENLFRELFDYYNAGGLETIEEIELALLLRDQEAFNTEVVKLLIEQ